MYQVEVTRFFFSRVFAYGCHTARMRSGWNRYMQRSGKNADSRMRLRMRLHTRIALMETLVVK
jgi:hypothetical protein